MTYTKQPGWSGHCGRASSGSSGSSVGVGTVGSGVGATVGATVGGGAVAGGSDAGTGVAGGVGRGAVGSARLGPGLAIATGPRDATGMSRPPRPATKVTAKTALAATNRADARTAGVRVRRSSCPVGPSNPLLRRFAGPGL